MNYECPKCLNTTCKKEKLLTLSKTFFKYIRFVSLTCNKCTYTEFFKE